MPKTFSAEPWDAETVEGLLHARNLTHLAVRQRGAVLTIESGPSDDRFPHARLRRVSVHLWQLEMPTHSGRWEPTPFRASCDEIVELLLTDFAWTLTDILAAPENPGGTSDPEH